MKIKPVLFIIFNRPDVTAQVFEAIARAKPSQLFIAADGPRADRDGEFEKCQQARKIVEKIDWDCEVKTLFREENLGCKLAVSGAIDWFFEHVESGIILEDDCLPSDTFFSFCSEMLDRYESDMRVMMISGSNFQDGVQRGNTSYYFSKVFHIWGWATWRRAWNLYDREMEKLEKNLSILDDLFSDKMLSLNWKFNFGICKTGKVNTWDYQWRLTCFLQNGLSIVPNKNLISNIGFGEDATHTLSDNSIDSNRERFELSQLIHPEFVYENKSADSYYWTTHKIYLATDKMSFKLRYRRKRKIMRLEKAIAEMQS